MLIIAWLLCSIAAWFIYAEIHRKQFDVTIGIAALITLLSAGGPFSLFVIALVWVSEYAPKLCGTVILKRKG